MEIQRSTWSEEDLPRFDAPENEARQLVESEKTKPLSIEENSVATEGIIHQASISPESSVGLPTDLITEKTLELRHEIQDGPSWRSAVSVGSVIADLSTSQSVISKDLSANESQPTVTPPAPIYESRNGVTVSASITDSHSMYRRAVQMGFVAGVCSIVLFALVKIVF